MNGEEVRGWGGLEGGSGGWVGFFRGVGGMG